MIPIVFVTDDNYAMPTAIAITSLIRNKNETTKYQVYIIASKLSKENTTKLESLESNDVIIKVINVEKKNETIGNSKIPKNIHVSFAALNKFFIPELLPEHNKALYLDGDILVRGDLTELYLTDLKNCYAAVVKDMKPMVSYQPNQNEKLGIAHSAYFNTGMMLLNLSLLRRDKITEKLVDYRTNGINYFMDQDAYNYVLSENVIYLEFKFNFIYSNYDYYSFDKLKKYYEFDDNDNESLLSSVVILHLSSKEKPWLFYDMPFTSEWDAYYGFSPYCNVQLLRHSANKEKSIKEIQDELRDCQKKIEMIENSFSYKIGRLITIVPRKCIEYNKARRKKAISYPRDGIYSGTPREKKIIVSLTTYPERINIVPYTILSLLKQTEKPDAIILYLSKEQFPNNKIPQILQKAKKNGLTIKYVDDDIKPHKKYYYSMQEYPEDIIITVDDDVYYTPKLIERLYKSYKSHPLCVSASRVHKIKFNNNGEILPYDSWQKEYYDKIGQESMRLIATGVGGVLYPPHSLNNLAFNMDIIKDTCLMADDLWLKVMEVINGTKVTLASQDQKIEIIDNSQGTALWKTNVSQNDNDKQLEKIFEKLGSKSDYIIQSIIRDTSAEMIECDYYNFPFKKDAKFPDICSFNQYLGYLDIIKRKAIIVMVVNDTASTYWDTIDFPLFFNLLKKPSYRSAYSSIIDYSADYSVEDTDEKSCTSVYQYGDLHIMAHSCGYNEKNLSYISYEVNGTNYVYTYDGVDNRGLYVLTLSKKSLHIIDFIRVDIHRDKKLMIRRC